MSSVTPVVYLFRGTSKGWPGNPNSDQHSMTYTSTDPLVATLFAVACRGLGPAVLLASPRGRFPELEPGPSDLLFQAWECSVTLAVRPIEFASRAEYSMDVVEALRSLAELGFPGLPQGLNGRSALQYALTESHSLGQRLNREQIRRFTALMIGAP